MQGYGRPAGPAPSVCTYPESVTGPSDIAVLIRRFERSLRAANKSPKRIESYGGTVRRSCMFLVDIRMPTDVRNLTRAPVETYISVQVERDRPKTASIRFGDLQPFFKWVVEEREMDDSPMVNMKSPHVPDMTVVPDPRMAGDLEDHDSERQGDVS